MLNHLRQHIDATLTNARSATLASSDPAGLRAHVVQCVASGILLYPLLPRMSDQLLNLHHLRGFCEAQPHICSNERMIR